MSYSSGEDPAILAMASKHGIDWRLLRAVRETENGGPGKEFGVLELHAPTWPLQAEICARTIRHTVGRYWMHFGSDPWDDLAGRYTITFLTYFSRGGPGYPGYAPLNVTNDPHGLNINHLGNLTRFYGV